MDMYQKRKMRQEKKNNQQNNGFDKIQLNWDNPTKGQLHSNLCK